MQLVDEQNDIAVAPHLVEHGADAFFKLAAVLCPCHHARKVEQQDALVQKLLRHVARGDLFGKPLGDSRLADARLADEHGVIFRPPRQDAQRAGDLLFPPDHGVEPPLACHRRQIAREFQERLAVFRLRAACTHLGQRELARRQAHRAQRVAVQLFGIHTQRSQQPHSHIAAVTQDTEQQMPRLDLSAARAHRLADGQLDRAARVRGEPLHGRSFRRAAPQLFDHPLAHCRLVDARGIQRAAGRVVLLAQHREQQVLAAHIAVPQLARRRLRTAQHMFSLQAEFPVIHCSTLRFLFVLSFLTGLFKNKHCK